jgi:hypothetical protein
LQKDIHVSASDEQGVWQIVAFQTQGASDVSQGTREKLFALAPFFAMVSLRCDNLKCTYTPPPQKKIIF